MYYMNHFYYFQGVDSNFCWSPQLLGNSQKEYEKQVTDYSIKTQQRYRGNLGKEYYDL